MNIKKFFKDRETLNNFVSMFRFIPDKQYLQIMYRLRMGKKLNLDNPTTFNEKLQWLKLYDRKPIYTTMVDKYEVKKYVADIIGEEYIIPTYGVWDKFDDIDFDKLPDQFVLKCTHDSGGLVIVKDKSKMDKEAAKKKIEKSLKTNFYWVAREWPYKDVKQRIIAETFMQSEQGGVLKDYKLWCFNGQHKITLVCSDRFSEEGLHEDFFDKEWNHLPIGRPKSPNSTTPIPRPENYGLMQKLAEKLSANIPFLRVDFYEVNGKIYFGELTFYPTSGFGRFTKSEEDIELGKLIPIQNAADNE